MADPAWLTANLALTPLAPVVNKPGERSAAELRAVVEQFKTESSERYRKRDVDGRPGDETFCNFFVRDVLLALSVSLKWPLRANEFHAYLQHGGAGWAEVPEWVAQVLANSGFPVLAVWTNPMGPHGHVALLVPSRNELDKDTTFIAQAGAINFSYGRLEQGFGKRPVVFFAHL